MTRATAVPAFAGPAGAPNAGRYWAGAITLASAMYATVGLRLHEIIPGISLLRPAILAMAIGAYCIMTRASKEARAELRADRSFRLLAMYFVWACIGAPFGIWAGYSINFLTILLPSLVLMGAILVAPPDRDALRRLQGAFVAAAGALVVGMFALGQDGSGRYRASASLDPNDIALILAFTFPLALGQLREKGWYRKIALVAAPLTVIGVLVTASRGGTIALSLGALIFTLGQRPSRRIGFFILLVAGGALAWTFGPPTFRERLATLTSLENDYNTYDYDGREAIWKRGRGYIARNPILGVGIGGFEAAEGQTLAELGRRGKWSTAHNSYIQSSAELGIPGGVLFISMLLLAALRVRRLWPSGKRADRPDDLHRPEYLAAVLAFAVGAYFLSLAYFWALYGLLGLLALADRTARAALASGSVPSPLIFGLPMAPAQPLAPPPPPAPPPGTEGWRARRPAPAPGTVPGSRREHRMR